MDRPRDGAGAEEQQVNHTVVGEELAQQEGDDGAEDWALDGANTADDDDKDHEGGLVVDTERSIAGDAAFLEIDQCPYHHRQARAEDVEDVFHAVDAGAEA